MSATKSQRPVDRRRALLEIGHEHSNPSANRQPFIRRHRRSVDRLELSADRREMTCRSPESLRSASCIIWHVTTVYEFRCVPRRHATPRLGVADTATFGSPRFLMAYWY